MHPADIYCAMLKRGITQMRLARDAGVHHSTVSRVIRGTQRNYTVAALIAAATDIPLNKLWPDGRYAVPPKATAA